MKSTLLFGLSVGALLVPAALWQSRPANPVPLAPASTQQPVRSITRLPVLIDSPGRYVLGGSLAAAARPPKGLEAGIVIQVDHVELDLGGHVLTGAEGTASGITIDLPEKRDALLDICVRNGTLTGWGGTGVDLYLVQGARVVDVHVLSNGAPRTSVAGLRVGPASVVQGCTAMSNTGTGIVAAEGSLVSDCLADRNGLEGFVLGAQATARACSATKNGADGFLLSGGGCSLVDCSAGGNTGDGISAILSGHVRACTVSNNGGSGIAVGRGSLVTECAATGNQRAGVFATNGLCRIEGNHLVMNGSGFDVEGSGNVVARNTVSDPDVAGSLLAASGPGGVFVSDPSSVLLVLSGVGSLRGKIHPAAPTLVEDGGPLVPWANIAVK